jgi:RsiW-degrading membrane proteinase PrsW (M82 family)
MEATEQEPRAEGLNEIADWKLKLHFWTRSPEILWSTAGIILAIGLCLAWFLSSKGPVVQTSTPDEAAFAELTGPHPDLATIVGHLEKIKLWEIDQKDFEAQVDQSALDHHGKMVLVAYSRSRGSDSEEPSAELLYYAHYIYPLPLANELTGDLYHANSEDDKAAAYYQREVQFFGSDGARAKLLVMLLANKDTDGARKLAADTSFIGALAPRQRIALLAGLHEWRALAQELLGFQKTLLMPIPLTVALVAGLAWFAIAIQAIQPGSVAGFRTVACVLAVFSGIISTLPTLFAVYWQQEMMGLSASGGLLHYLSYFFLGVGPREELIKLLFFMPFVPILLRRKQPLEMLLVAGCVGLGFAINENLLYFAQAGPAVAYGRFLTANFFHLSLTALSGLAFCEMCMQPLKKTLPFFGIFVALILAHGAYDALMPIVIRRFSVSMIIFMLVAVFFFRRLAVLRQGATDTFSMAATLVAGVSILGAVVLVAASVELGFAIATVSLISSTIGLIMVVLMFYFQLTEGMQDTDGNLYHLYK